MAVRFMDSFDHYVSGDLLQKWSGDFAARPGITAGQGRFSAGLVENSGGTSNGGLYKTLDAQGTWILGAAFFFTAVSASSGILGVYDAGVLQVDVRLNASHLLQVTRNGTVLGTGTTPVTAGVWHFIELKVVIHNSTGTAEVRLDGGTEISLTGQDTQNTANATADQVAARMKSNSVSTRIDDFYACDGTGSAPANTFLGDCKCVTKLPSGNGNSSVLVGSDGNSTDNYLLVDEAAQDGDTTYVESSTVGDKDTYAYENLAPDAGAVFGVQLLPWAKKTDAGTRSIVTVARLSATEVDSTAKALSTTYTYLPDVRETKPGGGAWSVTDFDNAEFGLKVNA